MKKKRSPLFVLFLTIMVDLLGVGILIPVIPLLVANPASPYYLLPNGFTQSDGFILLGFLTAIYPFGQFIATPIIGQLSDKYGRKNLLVISLFGTALSYILFAIGIITKNIPLLFISRALDGITGGNLSVAQASIADVTTPENRAKTFGLIGAAFGIGFVLGPYLGGKLSDPTLVSWFDATTPFWFAAILSFINVLSVIFAFQETLKNKVQHLVLDWGKSFKNVAHAFGDKGLRNIFITLFLFEGGFTFFTTFINVYLMHKLGFNQGNIGDLFSYIGIWIAIAQVAVTPLVAKYMKDYVAIPIALVLNAVFTLAWIIPNQWWGLLIVVPLFAIANGVIQAFLPAIVSKSVGEDKQGEILGINASVGALAQSIPAALSGFIAASLSDTAPIIVSTIVVALSGIFFALFYKPNKNAEVAAAV